MTNTLMENWEKPWKEINFQDETLDSTDLEEENLYTAFAELGNKNEYGGVEFGYTDYLDNFYKKHNHINENLLDEDGWLTIEALTKLENFYIEQLTSQKYWGRNDEVAKSIWIDENQFGDDPHYTIRITVPYDEEGTVEEVFRKYVTPFYNCIQNVTDPGTFNSPYIFSEIQ